MARLIEDDLGRPIPQVQTPDGTAFEAWKGANGAGRVTGDIDHDAADAGSPVKIGGKAADVAALPADVAAGDRVNALFDLKGRLVVRQDLPLPAGTNKIGQVDVATLPVAVVKADALANQADDLKVTLDGEAVDTELPAAAALADGAANPTAPAVGAAGLDFNGSGWDRRRGNLQGILLASAARTATVSSQDQTNYNGRGLHVVLEVTATSGAPSITLKIEGKTATGTYYTLLQGAAVTAIGVQIYRIFPGAAVEANKSANDIVPRTWRVTVEHANADSITYSVCYSLVL